MNRLSPWLPALVAGTLLLISSSTAFANPYSYSCLPETVHPLAYNAPRATIVLDRSGSMNNDGDKNRSRLEIAKEVLGEFAQAMYRPGHCLAGSGTCDQMQLGLGWFSSGSGYDISPSEDNYWSFSNKLQGYDAGGSTRIDKAASMLLSDSSLQDHSRTNYGIIVTDGAPNGGSTNGTIDVVRRTLYRLCAARNRANAPLSTYIIGFSRGTNVGINDLFATAGGTGLCCEGSGCCDAKDSEGECLFPPNQIIDPCDEPVIGNDKIDHVRLTDGFSDGSSNRLDDDLTCRGSLQANSGSELKDQLLSIASSATCTFPLNVPAAYPKGSALEDPRATRVTFSHASWAPDLTDPIVIPHMSENKFLLRDRLKAKGLSVPLSNDYTNEGWEFADAARTKVRFTPKLCALTNRPEATRATTQLACPCYEKGTACDVPCDPNDGSDIACEINADGDSVRAGRCRPGTLACVTINGLPIETCVSDYSPQPEICNGVDDDCSGEPDDMERANPHYASGARAHEWDQDRATLAAHDVPETAFCGFKSVCGCGPEGPDALGAVPNATDNEWEMYLDTWTGNCGCSEALMSTAEDGWAVVDDPIDAYDDPNAPTCAALSPASAAHAPGWALALLGAMFGLLGAAHSLTRRRT